jgi:hypothetical protein
MNSALSKLKNKGIPGTRNKVLLVCGMVSSAWFFVINIIIPLQDKGYNIASQTVSELSAIEAPTRTLWIILCSF